MQVTAPSWSPTKIVFPSTVKAKDWIDTPLKSENMNKVNSELLEPGENRRRKKREL